MRLFRNSVQMITYAPHFISTVVIVGMLFQFLASARGFHRCRWPMLLGT